MSLECSDILVLRPSFPRTFLGVELVEELVEEGALAACDFSLAELPLSHSMFSEFSVGLLFDRRSLVFLRVRSASPSESAVEGLVVSEGFCSSLSEIQ
jgi:hypothetical protein